MFRCVMILSSQYVTFADNIPLLRISFIDGVGYIYIFFNIAYTHVNERIHVLELYLEFSFYFQ